MMSKEITVEDKCEYRAKIPASIPENSLFRKELPLVHCTVPVNSSEPSKKKAKYEQKPKHSIRYDEKNHLPGVDSNKDATRCKLEGCTYKSHHFCMKCNVHLCIQKDRNCYQKFHVIDES